MQRYMQPNSSVSFVIKEKKFSLFNVLRFSILLLGFFIYCSCAWAVVDDVEMSENKFKVELGASRIIYNPRSNGASLRVKNSQEYPILVETNFWDKDFKGINSFIASPPLFRLDGNRSSLIRIQMTNDEWSRDRETMMWVCVRGIPPKLNDKWAKGNSKPNKALLNINVSVNNCIKMFVRSSELPGSVSSAASALKWEVNNNKVIANNPSPFFILLKDVKFDGDDIVEPAIVEPFGAHVYHVNHSKISSVEWRVVTDTGGTSKAFSTILN
ncbi:fimbria/pilus periplasmic chaperone [Aeromonas salmonicida]